MTNKGKLSKNFGKNLYRFLEEKQITKEEFAEGIDVSVRVVYDYINDIKQPTLERFVRIVQFLEVQAEDLWC